MSKGRDLDNLWMETVKGDRHAFSAAEILVMRAWDEMDYNEIAHVLACPIGTVRSRLSRARALLRTEIDAGRPQEKAEPNRRVGNVTDGSPIVAEQQAKPRRMS